MPVKYWIAQHVSDLLRNEPRNIGVLVEFDGLFRARFVGETDVSQIDRRKLRAFRYPEVYEQWLKYWRTQIDGSAIDKVLNSSGSHYRVVQGGEVDDVAAGEEDEILNYLYSLLVSDGGFYEAIGEGRGDEFEATALAADVVDAFRDAELLATGRDAVPHPVRRAVPISGMIGVQHKPAFVQENGVLYVMETVDFTTAKKRISRDHAGWAAYMFKDIRAARSKTEPIAIVRFTEPDEDQEEVQNGLALLRNEGEIVNWLQDNERDAFLKQRRDVAFAEPLPPT